MTSAAPPVAEDRDDDRIEAAIQGILRDCAWTRPPRNLYETWARVHASLVVMQIMPPCHRTYAFVRHNLRSVAATACLEAMRDPATPGELAIPESEPDHLERRRALLDEAVGDPDGWPPGGPIVCFDGAIGVLGYWLHGLLDACRGGARIDETQAASFLARAAIRALAEIPGLAGAEGDPLGETVMPQF